jgi:hypothetical protein
MKESSQPIIWQKGASDPQFNGERYALAIGVIMALF